MTVGWRPGSTTIRYIVVRPGAKEVCKPRPPFKKKATVATVLLVKRTEMVGDGTVMDACVIGGIAGVDFTDSASCQTTTKARWLTET
jgi:hypothetical protein